MHWKNWFPDSYIPHGLKVMPGDILESLIISILKFVIQLIELRNLEDVSRFKMYMGLLNLSFLTPIVLLSGNLDLLEYL